MKYGKRIMALVLILGLCLVASPILGQVQAARILTFDRTVQINDYQLVLEFSEPIAVDLLQENNGPYVAIRLVTNEKNELGKSQEGTVLQWKGNIEYADSNHDKLVWTLADNRLGVESINDIMNYNGELAAYSHYAVRMCVEEIPYDSTIPAATGLLDNITTADGEVHLSANRPIGYDGAYTPIEVDFDYDIDMDKTESCTNTAAVGEIGIAAPSQEDQAEPTVVVEKYNPLYVAGILGGSGLIAIILIVIGVVARKRRAA